MTSAAEHLADPSFTLRGMRNGSLVNVTWRAGVLTGDPPTVDLIETEAEVAEQRHRDPVAAQLYVDAPFGEHRRLLDDPASARFLIERNMDIVRERLGAVPS